MLEVQFGKSFKKRALGEHGYIRFKLMVGLLALLQLKYCAIAVGIVWNPAGSSTQI